MLEIGRDAPPFELPDQAGRPVRLNDLLQRGPLVIYFYPADFTPVCSRQACMFRDRHDELIDAGCGIVGISPQSSGSHERFRERFNLPFDLLSDETGEVIEAYDAKGPMGLIVRRLSYLVAPDGRIADAAKADLMLGAHREFVDRVLDKVTGGGG